MNGLSRMLADARGVASVCGFPAALRWAAALLAKAPEVLRSRTLECADRTMGEGPFEVRVRGNRFRVGVPPGEGPAAVFSGIREMYVRDVYLSGKLEIRDGDLVVDLGANMGNFTNLALSFGPSVRVIAVEPSRKLNRWFAHSVALNGWGGRAALVNGFIGEISGKIREVVASDPDYRDAPAVAEDDLVSRFGLERIDFLKCDIEGGEFGLIGPGSRLIRMARQVAAEVHGFAGEPKAFLAYLEGAGFSILSVKGDPDGTCTVLARKGRDGD
jgi:FkbM family methyltransferase